MSTSEGVNLNTVGPWSTENPGSVSFLGKVYACFEVRRDLAGEVQGMLVYDEQSINADRYRWMAIWMGAEGKLCARTGYTESEARDIVDAALRGRS